MKTGIIDVGGGLRDIYGAGVFDMCMDKNIHFDYCIGVSAGSANLTSYLAGQRRRSFRYYYDYSFRKEYMGIQSFIKNNNFFNLDYVYGDLGSPDGECPLDFDAFMKNPSEFVVVASEAESGKPRYFTKDEITKDDYGPVKASCTIPVICTPCIVKGVKYFDGAITDPVPIKKALADGCDRLVLILTRPLDPPRSPLKDESVAKFLYRTYPISAHNLRLRAKRYNESVEYAKELQKEGKLLIVAPDDISGVDTARRSKEALLKLYCKGYGDASVIPEFLGM